MATTKVGRSKNLVEFDMINPTFLGKNMDIQPIKITTVPKEVKIGNRYLIGKQVNPMICIIKIKTKYILKEKKNAFGVTSFFKMYL